MVEMYPQIKVVKKVYIICADPYDEDCPSHEKDETSITKRCCRHYCLHEPHECKLSMSWTDAKKEEVSRG